MTFPTDGFSATPLAEQPTALTRILWGNSSYFVICSLQITPYFLLLSTFSSQYWRTIAVIFMPLKIVNYHLETSRSTTCRPRDFSCTPRYAKHGNHYFVHLVSSENEIYWFDNCEIVLHLGLLDAGVVFSIELMEP